MKQVANGLCEVNDYADAISVYEAELSRMRRLGAAEENILAVLEVQCNLSNAYLELGRHEDALAIRQEVYARRRRLAPEDPITIGFALNLANSLVANDRFAEAGALAREALVVARRVCGDAHDTTIGLRYSFSDSIVMNPNATQKDLREAKGELETLLRTTRRIFGSSHPRVALVEEAIETTNRRLSSGS